MKKCILCATAILLVFTLSACQPTPKESIVKEKNLDQMIEDATKEQPGTTVAPQGSALAEKIGAENTYVKELADTKGKVKIHVNADVFVPNTGSVTVQRVEQGKITQAQIDVLTNRLMKGGLFSGDSYRPSRSELQSEIKKVQDAMTAGGEKTASRISPKGRNTLLLQLKLEKLQSELETASDTATKIPSDGKLGPMDPELGSGEELYVLSQPADNIFQSIHVLNFSDGASMLDFYSGQKAFSKGQSYYLTREAIEASARDGLNSFVTLEELHSIQDIAITKKDAKKMADDLISELGLQNIALYSQEKVYGGSSDKTPDESAYANPPRCVWLLRYARYVNGIPATYTVWDCMKVENNYQSVPWSYEDLTVAVDDSGIVGFSWKSPYKATGTVTENSNVLSFRDAMSVFDTMALVVNAWEGYADGNPTLTGIDIRVDQIRFGLTRITEQNKRDSGLLVPCWDFFGTVRYISNDNGQVRTMDDGPIPVLTINAIDGSIINRSLGY